jgi:hypothetical protein
MYIYRIVALILRYIFEIPLDFFREFDHTFYPLMNNILWDTNGRRSIISYWINDFSIPCIMDDRRKCQS